MQLRTQRKRTTIFEVDFNLPHACVSDPSPYAPSIYHASCSETVFTFLAGYRVNEAQLLLWTFFFFRGWISVPNLLRNSTMRLFRTKFSAKTLRIQLLVTCLYDYCYYFDCTLTHSERILDDTQTGSMHQQVS